VSIDRSTVWAYHDGEPGEYIYSRYAHPTGVEAERELAHLEGAPEGQALLFASGSAAATAVLLALLEPGQTVALAEGGYFGTGVLMDELGRWGLRHVEFDQTKPPPDGVDLVWLEAPSNPFLSMPDLEAAVAHPAKVVVDSTVATPIYLRPLEHGADFVLHSGTKYLAGHSDALVGAVRRAGWEQGLAGARASAGGSGGTVVVLGRSDAEPLVERIAAELGAGFFGGSSGGAAGFGVRMVEADPPR